MRNVEINVFPIAKTRIDRTATREWLDSIGATGFEIPENNIISEQELVPALAGKRCYMSFEVGLNPNVTRIRNDWVQYIDNILKSGHGSVLEHATWTWAIEGVSRVFTGEMNRHRAGIAVSEGSMRYIRFDNIPWWIPNSMRPNKNDDADLALKKIKTIQKFAEVFVYVEDAYKSLVQLWDIDNMKDFHQKKIITSLLRRIIPMGVATGGIWTLNLRALRHILALRTDPSAEEEIAYVFSMIGKTMIEENCKVFGDFEQTQEGAWVPKYRKI